MHWVRLFAFAFTALLLLTYRPTWGDLSLSGWLHVIWADTAQGEAPGPRYILIDERGQWTEIELNEHHIRQLGGSLAFTHPRWVTIAGTRRDHARVRVHEVRDAPFAALQDAAPFAVTGVQPWVTILCRFRDTVNVTPHPKSYFDSLLGGVPPGLDHYWRKVSYRNITLTGSIVVGWYNLPQPRAAYVRDLDGDGFVDLDFQNAAEDCTAVADADVFFPHFVGVNLMFNQPLDCCAWGGTTTLSKDGQTKFYRITWEPDWGYAHQRVIAHEMGHGYGLPHSSGPYSATYDSDWDVMSRGGVCPPWDVAYGCVGVHTIAYHKDLLGWIPPERKYVARRGSSQTIILHRLSQAPSDESYLMAHIPIGGSTTQFYTVEARRLIGYDRQTPKGAVVIHHVDTTRSDRPARVVDHDGNGNPNDAGAQWRPGETFSDPTHGVTVRVNVKVPGGFSVTIRLGELLQKPTEQGLSAR